MVVIVALQVSLRGSTIMPPDYSHCPFCFLIAAAVLGFAGIMIVLILMLIRMALSSLGMPYLSPLPLTGLSYDIIVRRPVRPTSSYMEGMENQVRQGAKGEQE